MRGLATSAVAFLKAEPRAARLDVTRTEALPVALRGHSGTLSDLAEAYKQINFGFA